MSPASPRELARELVQAALEAADPREAVLRALRLEGQSLWVGRRRVDLSQVGRLLVVGGGKAAEAMAGAVVEVLGPRIDAGVVVTRRGSGRQTWVGPVQVVRAAHPLPDESCPRAASRVAGLLTGLHRSDLVLCLLSGGASSLMTLPGPGLDLEQTLAVTGLLLAAGAPIEEINTVRKHMSALSGGRLAALAAPARVISLILSDVVGSPLSVIASGPTAPDPGTYGEALDVLGRYRLLPRTPAGVLRHLRQGAAGKLAETPKPGDPVFRRVHNVVVAGNPGCARAVVRRAASLGLRSRLLTTYLQGEAREVGRVLAALLREEALHGRPLPRPCCLVLGGETTVTLGSDRAPGKGGRNQELALSAALDLEGLQRVALVALATDGLDGPTDAGGALVDGSTAARARAQGRDPRRHLERHDAYPLLAGLGDLLMTGPTGTNVCDLVFLLAL